MLLMGAGMLESGLGIQCLSCRAWNSHLLHAKICQEIWHRCRAKNVPDSWLFVYEPKRSTQLSAHGVRLGGLQTSLPGPVRNEHYGEYFLTKNLISSLNVCCHHKIETSSIATVTTESRPEKWCLWAMTDLSDAPQAWFLIPDHWDLIATEQISMNTEFDARIFSLLLRAWEVSVGSVCLDDV